MQQANQDTSAIESGPLEINPDTSDATIKSGNPLQVSMDLDRNTDTSDASLKSGHIKAWTLLQGSLDIWK